MSESTCNKALQAQGKPNPRTCAKCGLGPCVADAPVAGAVKDNVNHPSHYTAGKVECIDALDAATTGLAGIEAVCTANAIKYLWRWKQKNGAEDLKKARWYINRLLGESA